MFMKMWPIFFLMLLMASISLVYGVPWYGRRERELTRNSELHRIARIACEE
jgi:hypothetical protein